MPTIRKLVLKNFKRFRALELDFDPELNILVGGNEAGKSSVLQAIDIVLSASRSKVETLGLECLFNVDCIANFLAGQRRIADLPELLIEVTLMGSTVSMLSTEETTANVKIHWVSGWCAGLLTSTPRKFRTS